ncbi:hypothetical protein LZ31DRAFT_544677 [Colletotrichum somersetense]|nr:hypothetical protein LZ31DRAFT_544677 [Colletotrichum somersetense]
MHEYAGAAYSFLSQHGAERSAAFVGWFGYKADLATRSRWAKIRNYAPNGGLSLLHEMTHLQVISGPCEAKDYAYNPYECIQLDDERAINNAQNYMFFALEVLSNPENARKQVDWHADNKRQDALGKLRADVKGQLETQGPHESDAPHENDGPHESHDPNGSYDPSHDPNVIYDSNSIEDFIDQIFAWYI